MTVQSYHFYAHLQLRIKSPDVLLMNGSYCHLIAFNSHFVQTNSEENVHVQSRFQVQLFLGVEIHLPEASVQK